MTGLENILAKIDEDARTQAAAILDEARQQAEQIATQAQQQAKQQAADIVAKGEKTLPTRWNAPVPPPSCGSARRN